MNTSILRGIAVSANEGTPDAKRWVMPIILESFGLAAAFKAFDSFDAGKPWKTYCGYAALGILLMIGGVLWAVFRKRLLAWWPWRQLRIARAELAAVQEKELVALPLPSQARLVKPQHNVQCAGFKFLVDPPLDVAGLYFQNVPIPGKLIGKFEYPRLRVVYYDNSTGQEIADMCPLQWHGSEYRLSEITAAGSYAEIAVFLMGANVWRIFEEDESSDAFKLNHKEIPAGEYRIIAKLSGSYSLHIPPVEGILTLGKDGIALFKPIKGVL